MAHAHADSPLRGAILAAASLLGVRVEITDGDRWEVRDGAAIVGLEYVRRAVGLSDTVSSSADIETATALTLLLLWESVREVRVAPLRRERRLAVARHRPELEPILGVVDRMLAAAEILMTMPHMRSALVRAMVLPLPAAPNELPRHLQWVCVLLAAAVDIGQGRRFAEHLAPEVQAEFAVLVGDAPFSQECTRARDPLEPLEPLLRIALTLRPTHTAIQRFERLYGVVAPPYERLYAIDAGELGLDTQAGDGATVEALGDEALGTGANAGGSDDAQPGGEADVPTDDGETEAARAGDHPDGAEGSDLFEAEQAGFVKTVLATPLPAHGRWADDLDPPQIEATPGDGDARESGGGGARGSVAPALAEYSARRREYAASIERLREVWSTVIADRIGQRRTLTRVPEQDGDMLDRLSLVRLVSEVHAGTERPRAFISRHRMPKRSRRTGSTDYVLLVDRSSSMQGALADAAADAALIMLESLAAVMRDVRAAEQSLGIELELNLRTALIVFDSQPVVVKPLSGALDDDVRGRMFAEVRSSRGSTDDATALSAATRELTRGTGTSPGLERQRIVIVVSDGGTDDGGAAARELRAMRASGIVIFGIGLRTDDLITRYAPTGVRVNDPALLSTQISALIAQTGVSDASVGQSR